MTTKTFNLLHIVLENFEEMSLRRFYQPEMQTILESATFLGQVKGYRYYTVSDKDAMEAKFGNLYGMPDNLDLDFNMEYVWNVTSPLNTEPCNNVERIHDRMNDLLSFLKAMKYMVVIVCKSESEAEAQDLNTKFNIQRDFFNMRVFIIEN